MSKAEIFEQGFSLTISRLEDAGKQVVIFIDVPELDFYPKSCVDARPLPFGRSGIRTPCGVPRSQVMQRQADYRNIIAHLMLQHRTVQVFDPLPYLCDVAFCRAKVGDRLLYRDSNHLSAFGSSFIAAKFRESMHIGKSPGS